MAYNSSRHSTTGYTPHLLMFGREMWPSPKDEESGVQKDGEDNVDHFIRKMEITFRRIYALTREQLQAAVVRQKEQYDKRAGDRAFHRGQGVWLYNPHRRKGRTPKLDVPWEGPYAVSCGDHYEWCLVRNPAAQEHEVKNRAHGQVGPSVGSIRW